MEKHWGEWVRERARFVGFVSQRTLASVVGCRQEVMSRWLQLSNPPARMTKGFDVQLAYALKVDLQTLFTGYCNVEPSDAPLQAESPASHGDEAREQILAAAVQLHGDRLRMLGAAARALCELSAVPPAA